MRTTAFLFYLFVCLIVKGQESGPVKIVRLSGVSAGYYYGAHFRSSLNVYDVQEMLPDNSPFSQTLDEHKVVYAPSYGNQEVPSELFISATLDPYNPGQERFCRYFQLQFGLNMLNAIRYIPGEPYSASTTTNAGTHYHHFDDGSGPPDSALCYLDSVKTHSYTYDLQSRFYAVELAALFHTSYENRFQFAAGIGMAVVRSYSSSVALTHTASEDMHHNYVYVHDFTGEINTVDFTEPGPQQEENETVKVKLKGMRYFMPLEASARVRDGEKYRLFVFARAVLGVEKFSAVTYNSGNRYAKFGAGLRLQF